jgi:predicted HTH domain antitoxin
MAAWWRGDVSRVAIEVDQDLAEILALLDQPIDQVARELMVLELYRRGTISSGKAAALLHMSRLEFIRHSGELGIPYFQMSEEEWAAEIERIRSM